MSAYVIFIREGEVVDEEAMAAYRDPNQAAPPDPKMKPLVLYGEMDTIEGEPADGIVILEFPDMESARTWYYGEYNERAKLRQKAAPYRGFIVQGM